MKRIKNGAKSMADLSVPEGKSKPKEKSKDVKIAQQNINKNGWKLTSELARDNSKRQKNRSAEVSPGIWRHTWHRERFGTSRRAFGGLLERFRTILKCSGSSKELSWGASGVSWSTLGVSWSIPGPTRARPGASPNRSDTLWKPLGRVWLHFR